MSRVYIIKAGATFANTAVRHGDFDDWTRRGLGLEEREVRVVDAQAGESLPKVEECRGVVVTGSHAMVTDELDWSVRIERWMPELVKAGVPFLGICYGHQLLAKAMGGEVDYHPKGREIGTVEIELLPGGAEDSLFRGFPKRFSAHVSHSQTVISLPPGAMRLARSSFEGTHAFRIGSCAWGVQFHPEYGIEVMKAYVTEQEEELRREGLDPAALCRAVKPSPHAARALRRFARISGQDQGS